MVCIVCFDIFAVIRLLKHDRCSSGVSSFRLAKFVSMVINLSHGLKISQGIIIAIQFYMI